MVGVLLFVLQKKTSSQIYAAIHNAVETSRNNLQELEQTWKAELASVSRRYARSTRILGAFDAAVEDGDPAVLAEAADYDTKLAGLSGHLFLFFDLEGRILCTLLDGRAQVQNHDGSMPARKIPRYEESFGYSLWNGQLYAAHTASLNLFSRKIGYMLVGFPLSEEVIEHLGRRVDGQVCFVVGPSAVVATSGIARSGLLGPMEAAAGIKGSRILHVSSRTWVLFSGSLNNWKYAPGIFRPAGAPVIWENPYQVGAMFAGGLRSLDFRLAVMDSAPSSEPDMWNYQVGQKTHPSSVAHVGYRIVREFYLGTAYGVGPYLDENAKSVVGEAEFDHYRQKLWQVEFLFERDKTQIRGEAFHDTWEVENVLDYPVDMSGYVEIKQKFLTGFYSAFRYGTIHYNRIRRSSGQEEVWDFSIWRAQAAVGYRILRNLEVRAEYMWNRTSGLPDPQDDLFSIQCRMEF